MKLLICPHELVSIVTISIQFFLLLFLSIRYTLFKWFYSFRTAVSFAKECARFIHFMSLWVRIGLAKRKNAISGCLRGFGNADITLQFSLSYFALRRSKTSLKTKFSCAYLHMSACCWVGVQIKMAEKTALGNTSNKFDNPSYNIKSQ